ncbi:hypothetical protein TrRE_jg8060, partial [Triparma retinervis]
MCKVIRKGLEEKEREANLLRLASYRRKQGGSSDRYIAPNEKVLAQRTRNDIFDASVKDNPNRVLVLVENGVDVNVLNESGATALMVAAEAGSLEVVKKLIELGADLERTALCSNGSEERVSALFAACI